MQRLALLSSLPLLLATLLPTLMESECGTVCAPGEVQQCSCPSGEPGEAVCDASGQTYGDCQCGEATPTGGDTPTPGPSGDFAVELEPNPSCVVSCIVRWTTTEPASSWVEFGPTAPNKYRTGDAALTTEHEVIVVGLTPSASHRLRAVSKTADGQVLRSEVLTYETSPFPYDWLSGRLESGDETRIQSGWTLFNVVASIWSGPQAVVMVDSKGRTVWYYLQDISAVRLDVQASYIDGDVLIGPGVSNGEPIYGVDLAGRRVWEGPIQQGSSMLSDQAMHHVLAPLTNGDLLTTIIDRQTVNGVEVSGEILRQFDWDNQTVWTWTAFEHTDDIPLDVTTLNSSGEWLHTNSATIDLEANIAYMSSYTKQAAYKIDRTDGHVLWTVGKSGDFLPDPINPNPWFGTVHSFDPIGDSRYLLYDNGDYNRTFSRALIYTLDEATMQATIEWEYPGEVDDYWYNMTMGDVDLLENGNVLILGGGGSPNNPTRIMEVTPDGVKVWHYTLYNSRDQMAVSFQAMRMPALVTSIN